MMSIADNTESVEILIRGLILAREQAIMVDPNKMQDEDILMLLIAIRHINIRLREIMHRE